MATLEELEVKVDADTDGADSKLAGFAKVVGTTFAAVAAAAVGVAAGLTVAAAKTAEYGDDLDKTSARMGVHTDFLQDMKFWASQNGIEAGRLDSMMARFTRTVGDAAEGTGTAADAFKDLGVKVQDSEGDLRGNEAVMRDTIAALQEIKDPSAQAAAAYDIFGRAAIDILPAIRDGALSIEDATAAMDGMGRMSQEQIDTAVKFTDAWDKLKLGMGSLLRDGATPVMSFFADTMFPIFNDKIIPLLRDVTDAFKEDGIGGALEVLRDGVKSVGPEILDTLQDTFSGMLNFLTENITGIVDFVLDARGSLFDAAISMFESIVDALPTIIPRVVEAIVGMVTKLVATLAKAAPLILEGALMLVTGLVDGIVKSIPVVLDGIVSVVDSILTALVDSLPKLLDAGIQLLVSLVEGIVGALPKLQVAVLQIIPKIVLALVAMIPQLLTLGMRLLVGIIQGFVQALPEFIRTVQEQVIPALIDTLQNELPQMLDEGIAFLTEFATGMAESIDQIARVVTEDVVPAFTQMIEDNPEIIDAGLDALTAFIEGVADNLELISTLISDKLIPLMLDTMERNLPALTKAGASILGAVIVGIVQMVGRLQATFLTRILPTILVALARAIPKMQAAGLKLIVGLVGGLIRGLDNNLSRWLRALPGRIRNFFAGAGRWLLQAGRNIISGLINGIMARFDSVRSTLSRLTSLLPSWKGPAAVDRQILAVPAENIMAGFADALAASAVRLVRPALAGVTANLSKAAAAAGLQRDQFFSRGEFTAREWDALMSGGVDAYMRLWDKSFGSRASAGMRSTEVGRVSNTLSLMGLDRNAQSPQLVLQSDGRRVSDLLVELLREALRSNPGFRADLAAAVR